MNLGRTAVSSAGWLATAALALACALPHAFGATLTVTNLSDSGPGTLRDRIAASASGDGINFGVIGTILLNSELTISKSIFLGQYGIGMVVVSGNRTCRVFNVIGGTNYLVNLAIIDGRVVGANGAAGQNGQDVYGGGVQVANGARVALGGCIVSNNVVMGGQPGAGALGGTGSGGGVANLGEASLGGSLVVSNYALGGPGGATGTGGQGYGGGVYTAGLLYSSDSTLHANVASGATGAAGNGGGAGGGIYMNSGNATLTASTITSNSAVSVGPDSGGGIRSAGALLLFDCTIVGNRADVGGGITGGSIANTILAGNSAGTGPDGSGNIISSDYNFIQNPSGINFFGTITHNITGLDPKLGPLQYNGSPYLGFMPPTLAPLPGSPVIDQGKSIYTADERGFSRPYDTQLPNAAGGNGADIGAVEVHPGILMVANTSDSGAGSLRQALADNAGLGGSNTIVFSNTVIGTITLSSGDLLVPVGGPVTILGPGPNLLSVSANHSGRVFDVRDTAQISGLTIRDGLINGGAGLPGSKGFDGQGGGIYVDNTILSLSNCVVLSNTVVGGAGGDRSGSSVGNGGRGLGGSIYSVAGSLVLLNCRFEANSSVGGQGGNGLSGSGGFAGNGLGGGICTLVGTDQITACSFVNNVAHGGTGGLGSGGAGLGGQAYGAGLYSGSTVLMIRSTISGGNAIAGTGGGGNGNGYGGGIYNYTDLSLYSCTIASNNATGSTLDSGGGIYNQGTLGITNSTIAGNQADYGGGLDGFATLANTILAGNTAGTHGPDADGTITSMDYNLIQSTNGLILQGATNHVLLQKDPLLGPLQANGGPTFTMALLPGSPAIDQGLSFGLLTDQRGFTRAYNLPSVGNAGGGDGSDIGAFEFIPTPRLTIQSAANNNVLLVWSTDAADFHLLATPSLKPPSTWAEVTNARAFVGNQVYVTNAAAGQGMSYRLSFPPANQANQ